MLKSTSVKTGRIKVDDNFKKIEESSEKKKTTKIEKKNNDDDKQHWLFPVVSGRFGHKCVPFLY